MRPCTSDGRSVSGNQAFVAALYQFDLSFDFSVIVTCEE